MRPGVLRQVTPCRSARPLHDVLGGDEVGPGAARPGIVGQGEVGVQAEHGDTDDRDAHHAPIVARCRAAPGAPTLPSVLVWMDLEMTGLDPTRHVIVEIATLVTDDGLEVVAEGPDLVIHQPPAALEAMEDVVREMHTKSGLLAAIEASTVSLADAGRATLDFIKAHVPAPRSVPLCGNSIGTDRRVPAGFLPGNESYPPQPPGDVSPPQE